MPDDVTPQSDTFVPDITISDDSYDVSAMADITHMNQENEEQETSDDGGQETTDTDLQDDGDFETSDDAEDVEGDDSSETDDGFEDEERGDEVQERTSDDEVTFKVDGKDVNVPKDAEVEIKIDGKTETMSLQEALNQASGKIHVSREITRVKQREEKLEANIQDFKKETEAVHANAEALLEIKDPFELCEYICELKGGDPDELLAQMVRQTVEHIKKFKEMTPRERELEKENRKYKRLERQRAAKAKVSQAATEKTEKEQALTDSLEAEGFTREQFFETISDLQEKAKNGEELGFDLDTVENPTEDDIIEYMVVKDLHDRVTSGVEKLNESLLDDTDFIDKAKQAILRTESYSGKMSQAEVDKFLEQALQLDNKALSKTLSKSAKKANSKKATLQGQEEFDDEGPGSLEELNSSLRNITF